MRRRRKGEEGRSTWAELVEHAKDCVDALVANALGKFRLELRGYDVIKFDPSNEYLTDSQPTNL